MILACHETGLRLGFDWLTEVISLKKLALISNFRTNGGQSVRVCAGKLTNKHA
jgi:hypothetical protein